MNDAELNIIQDTANFVRRQLDHETSGHDWWHIFRVWRTAQRLAKTEPCNHFILELAALLHDIADWKFHDGDETRGPAVARAWLTECHIGSEPIEQICAIIQQVSYKGAGVATPMDTIEGMIVQDADRLDALGAIGIARCFAYGGYKRRKIHDPALSPQLHPQF